MTALKNSQGLLISGLYQAEVRIMSLNTGHLKLYSQRNQKKKEWSRLKKICRTYELIDTLWKYQRSKE
jgi:hypothetical protein